MYKLLHAVVILDSPILVVKPPILPFAILVLSIVGSLLLFWMLYLMRCFSQYPLPCSSPTIKVPSDCTHICHTIYPLMNTCQLAEPCMHHNLLLCKRPAIPIHVCHCLFDATLLRCFCSCHFQPFIHLCTFVNFNEICIYKYGEIFYYKLFRCS